MMNARRGCFISRTRTTKCARVRPLKSFQPETIMPRRHLAFIFTLASLVLAWVFLEAAQRGGAPGAGPGRGGGAPQPPVGSLPTRRFEKITEGIYYATSTGSLSVS